MSNGKASSYSTSSRLIPRPQPTQSSFEHVVQSLRLTPEQYAKSPELKAWVSRNKSFKYVPPDVLEVFGFEGGAEV